MTFDTKKPGMTKIQALRLLQQYDAMLVLDAIHRIQEEASQRVSVNSKGSVGK